MTVAHTHRIRNRLAADHDAGIVTLIFTSRPTTEQEP